MNRIDEALSFRQIFNQPIVGTIDNTDTNKSIWDLQLRLIQEEFKEFFDAADVLDNDCDNEGKRENLLKELSDLVFVCYQFAAAFGMDLDEALRRVYESNMSKLDEHGKPIYRADGKVLKGPKYRPPHLQSLIK
jgi:NTP pyrophosphatase (non-canonical NTP hydrolase)